MARRYMRYLTENLMALDPISTYIIFAFCMAGCSLCAYKCGERGGILGTLNYLEDEGIIDLEEEE